MLNKKGKFISVLYTLFILAFLITGCSSTHQQESTGQYIDSSIITAKVKAKLLADEKVSALPITVKTYKSTVQLSGFVNNASQKIRAEEIARNVRGVQSVQNSLIIKSH